MKMIRVSARLERNFASDCGEPSRGWKRALAFALCLYGVAFLIAPSTAAGADVSGGAPSKTVRLLTVGNSFSGNATRYLGDLARSAGHELIMDTAAAGGAPLELHWNRAQLHEREPENPGGLYGKRGLKEALQGRDWDAVTIQQASIKSHDEATYRPFAKNLFDYIKRYAPDAQVLVHQTWAYRRDDPRFRVASPAQGEPRTQKQMYEMLKAAYASVAAELGVRCIPVGDAFYLADTDPVWGYRPDPAYDFVETNPQKLPLQVHSLHVGWLRQRQPDGTIKLSMDGHHANTAGQYLGACVWFEVLFKESVVGNKFVASGVDREHAQFLQETAHRAVEASSRGSRP